MLMRRLAFALALLTSPAYAFDGVPQAEPVQYGGGYGIYGPYGRPPPGAYDYPPGYIPPIERPRIQRPRGADFDACIYYGYCRGLGPSPAPRPRY